VAIFGVDDLVKPLKCFVQADYVMQDLFVDLVGVFELAEVDALGGANNLDFSCVCAVAC
jgi:hypothetical protein